MDSQAFLAKNEELEAYARRLEAQLSKIRKRGGLAGGYSRIDPKTEERQRKLRERVDEAIRAGKFWRIVMAEFARDYSSLFDNLFALEERIDIDFNAHSRNGR